MLWYWYNERPYPELQELSAGSAKDFQGYANYFRKLASDRGGEYAFQVLLKADLPGNPDLHLLGHIIGSVLYAEKGIDAINACTHDFRNACSHSVVIGILQEHGEGSLPDIAETCKRAPGGRGAYTMCFHGLGHGILAYNGYDFEQAILMCKETGTPAYNNREYIECVGGATMEMIAGVHDRIAWEKQADKYFKNDDALYPCNADFMPEEVRAVCYVHLTPHLFTAAGIDLNVPEPLKFRDAFSFCGNIPQEKKKLREACYGGFGKEFVTIAAEKDIRNIGSSEKPVLENIQLWCKEANSKEGEADCNSYARSSLFWGGENNPDAAFLFCEISGPDFQNRCYRELAGDISFYLRDSLRGQALCSKIPETYRTLCLP